MGSILRVGDNLIDLSTPQIMTIINVTPDSFFSGSRVQTPDQIKQAAERAIEGGTSILDIGGCSTRPGAKHVDEKEEYERVKMAVRAIRSEFDSFPISIDTYHASVVDKIAQEFGALLVNDISGGMEDDMFSVVSKYNLPYILCHLKGSPETMQNNAIYSDVINEILHFFARKIGELHDLGIYDIIVDPNFGFAKDIDHNFKIAHCFNQFSSFGCPLLAGVSRKSFICKTALCHTETALPATSAMHMALLERGANILRVHDTEEAMQTVRLFNSLMNI